MFQAIFVCGLSGWVVVHPDFAVVAPKHSVGFPKLQTTGGIQLYIKRYGPSDTCTCLGHDCCLGAPAKLK